MFRTELRKSEKLYDVSTRISRPENISESQIASWTIDAQFNTQDGDDWQTHTTYDFLRFEDFIQRDLNLPIWHIVSYTIWIYLRLIFHGTVFHFMKANWRFLTFITFPHIVFWCEVAILAFAASLVRKGLQAIGVPSPFDIPAAIVFFFATLWMV